MEKKKQKKEYCMYWINMCIFWPSGDSKCIPRRHFVLFPSSSTHESWVDECHKNIQMFIFGNDLWTDIWLTWWMDLFSFSIDHDHLRWPVFKMTEPAFLFIFLHMLRGAHRVGVNVMRFASLESFYKINKIGICAVVQLW